MDTIPANEGTVYLIHFASPIAPGRHTAQHYLGHAADLARRIQAHRRGRRYNQLGHPTGCARLVEVAHERGIDWHVARVWPGGYELERQMKAQHNSPRLCPLCNPRVARGERELTAAEIDELLMPF